MTQLAFSLHKGAQRVVLVCVVCGERFTRTQRQLRSTTGRACSRSCSTSLVNRTRGPVKAPPGRPGPSNPNWKGGISSDHYRYKKRFVERHPEKARAHQIVRRA